MTVPIITGPTAVGPRGPRGPGMTTEQVQALIDQAAEAARVANPPFQFSGETFDFRVGTWGDTPPLPGDWLANAGLYDVVLPFDPQMSYGGAMLQLNDDGSITALADVLLGEINLRMDYDIDPAGLARVGEAGMWYTTPDLGRVRLELDPYSPDASAVDNLNWILSFNKDLWGSLLYLQRGTRFWVTMGQIYQQVPFYRVRLGLKVVGYVSATPTPDPVPPSFLLTSGPQYTKTVALAAAQPTVMGKEIHSLAVLSDNRLYASYGDYDTNTGPIDVVSLDLGAPDTDFTSEITLATEMTWVFRQYGDDLYVPYGDPAEHVTDWPQAIYARRRSGVWTTHNPIDPPPAHAMDMLKSGDMLYIAGAAHGDGGAVVWESADDGETWTAALQHGAPGDRFYALCDMGDGYVMAWIYRDNQTYLRHPDTGQWTYEPIQNQYIFYVTDAHPFVYQGAPLAVTTYFNKAAGDHRLGLVSVFSRQEHAAQRQALQDVIGYQNSWVDIAVSPDGSRLWFYDGGALASIGQDETVLSWHEVPRYAGVTIAVSSTQMFVGDQGSVVRSYLLSDLPILT